MKIPFTVFLIGVRSIFAEPDFRTLESVGEITTVADHSNKLLRYYLPGEMQLASTADGRPQVNVLETRYRGTAVRGDAGQERYNSLLRVTLRIPQPSPASLEAIKARFGARVEIRPLPLERINIAVVHLPIKEGTATNSPHLLPASISDNSTAPDDTAVWSERHETLRLDSDSAQLLADSWRKGRLLLSVGYIMHSRGIPPDAPLSRLQGSPELISELARLSGRDSSAADAPGNPGSVLIASGALPVSVDAARWPDSWKRIDLNESLPADYPLIEARCYDFQNTNFAGLFEKRLVVEAEAARGRKVTAVARFQRDTPDSATQLVRFRSAVRLNLPYRYRIESVLEDGLVATTPWTTNTVWSQLLDISENARKSNTSIANQP